jgi:outer membrane receptor protein involved in Fe transport
MKLHMLLSTTLATGLLLAAPAQAQDAASEGATSRTASEPGNDVIVTAQRREESAENVGIALSVISGDDLVRRGVVNINQLQYQTPGLEAVPAFGGGQPQFRLRGVGFDDYASNNASPVGVYVDEVAKPYPIQTQGLLFDIARVEVLRGPQGTLYGRNTTGGAINFVTNRPTDEFSAGVDAEYGRFDLFRAEGFVSGPIAGEVKARIAAVTEQGGGFQFNRVTGAKLGDADRWGVRGQLAFDSGPFNLLLQAQYGEDHSEAAGLYLFRPLGTTPADRNPRATGWGASAAYAALLGINRDTKPFRDNDTFAASANLSYDLGGATLSSISAYETFNRREYNDWDATAAAQAGTFFGSKVDVFSQEIRLASDGDGPLRWLVGGYYANEKLRDRFYSDFVDSLGFIALTTYRQKAETTAGFAQLEYTLSPMVKLVGGVRVEHEERNLINLRTATLPVVGIGTGGDSSIDYTRVSGKAGVELRPSAGSLFYANVSHGVKSGAFTTYNTLTTSQIAAVSPESLWAYEVGTKNSVANDRLELNAAFFYYDYRDQQVQSAIYDTTYGAVGKIVNAPRSHIFGGEAEIVLRPASRLTISQGIGIRKGQFDRFVDLDIPASSAAGAARFVDRRGQDQGFPKVSYVGSVAYDARLGDLTVTPAVDYSFRDALQPPLLGPVYKVDPYWLVNATLTVSPSNGWWSIGVYGRNIFDKKYDLTRNFFLGGIDIAAPGRPASYGVRLRVKY